MNISLIDEVIFLKKRNIYDEIRRMHEDMDRLFSSAFFDFPSNSRLSLPDAGNSNMQLADFRSPVTDIRETENEVLATFEIPGAKKEDIYLNVTQDSIELKVQTKEEHKDEDKEKGLYGYRQSSSHFYRKFPLPSEVDSEKVKAKYNNGILEITLPKTNVEKKKSKKVHIE